MLKICSSLLLGGVDPVESVPLPDQPQRVIEPELAGRWFAWPAVAVRFAGNLDPQSGDRVGVFGSDLRIGAQRCVRRVAPGIDLAITKPTARRCRSGKCRSRTARRPTLPTLDRRTPGSRRR